MTRGYWLVASDGGVFAFGDAGFYGSTGGMRPQPPVVGMAATPDGRRLLAGGLRRRGLRLRRRRLLRLDRAASPSTSPIVGMAATPDGGGYWLVASDGGVFAFGDAGFYGSTGGIALNRPIVGMAATPDGGGYWLVASDGGVFAFGDAAFYGSTGGIVLNQPVVGMASTPGRRRLLAGGLRRRRLRLRRRRLLRLDRGDRPQPADRGHGRHLSAPVDRGVGRPPDCSVPTAPSAPVPTALLVAVVGGPLCCRSDGGTLPSRAGHHSLLANGSRATDDRHPSTGRRRSAAVDAAGATAADPCGVGLESSGPRWRRWFPGPSRPAPSTMLQSDRLRRRAGFGGTGDCGPSGSSGRWP